MAVHENRGEAGHTNVTQPDPGSLGIVERIFYYEHMMPQEAAHDNDNRSAASDASSSACFDAWAMPEYMRK